MQLPNAQQQSDALMLTNRLRCAVERFVEVNAEDRGSDRCDERDRQNRPLMPTRLLV
jgi:hypothetical protein